MRKNYWQPNIDNWIIKENDATAFGSNMNFAFSNDIMANGVPVKSEEEEEHDKLNAPYKGITSFSKLREKIKETIEHVYTLSKSEKKETDTMNPYERIIQMLEDADLKTMLDIASNEIKERNVSSF